jgi:hypothetical protein
MNLADAVSLFSARSVGRLLETALLAWAPPAQAQEHPAGQDSPQELAKKLANPISSVISVPFQENIDFGIGDRKGVKSTLNVQPVIPIALSSDWNLITRTIVPIIYQDDVAGRSSQFGLGDTVQSFFFSPVKPGPGGIIWGAGPVIQYRTESDARLGTGKWGAGATIVVVKQSGHDTFGFLANHLWSVAGDNHRPDVSATFLQPFMSHTTTKAATFTLSAESSYDWVGKHWVVPIVASASQLTHMGKQPISVGGGLRYYVEKPRGGPDWGARLIFTMLFPKK